MKKTLQDQYLLIKEGKGHKDVFLKEAKRQFPNVINNSATFEEAAASLKTKNIISENVVGLSAINSPFEPKKKESFETAFESFLAEARKKENEDEKVKAEEKKVSKPVEKDLSKIYDKTDDKNPDNLIFDQIMKGYYAEMKDPKNADKTMQQLKDIVLKNLAKDPIYYTKDGQFGVKDLGYVTEHPGLGEPKEPKGKYKSSGYGDLNESIGRNYPGELEGEYEGELQKIYGADIYDTLKSVLDISNSENDFIKKMTMSLTNETNVLPKSSEEKLRIWYRNNTLNLEEAKLRKVIREIIDEEIEEVRGGGNYGILTINPSGGGGGRRFVPDYLPFPVSIRKRFGDHMAYNSANETFYVSQILYNNLIKGYADDPSLKALVRDIPAMVKQLLNKTENYGLAVELPKQYKTYLPFVAPVSKAKEDKFNKAGDKQYWAEGDFLFPNLNKAKYSSEEGGTEEETGEEDVVENRVLTLKESVEKELAEINKEAENEVLEAKLQKITDAIERRQSKLGKLDEDEDMRALTDKKKVKELEKEIKALEKAKAKLEKVASKKSKVKKKEVIDEDEPLEDVELNEEPISQVTGDKSVKNAKTLSDLFKNIDKLQFKNLEEESEESEEY